MPLLASFKGTKVYLYYEDHEPPHFHAVHGEFEIVVEIRTLRVMKGKLPTSEQAELVKWASSRTAAIMAQWNRARRSLPIQRIP